MYKMCYFVPETHVEKTKQALFDAGAGRIGDYDSCAWQCLGRGQFRPLEAVDEYKVELVCADELIKDALAALKQAHPYEEPAYEIYRMEEL